MKLIIGATGTIGRELVKQLTGAGVRIRVLARDPKKAEAIKGPLVEIVPGDLGKPETLAPALKGIDRVFLLSPAEPRIVELQGNLIQAAKPAGIKLLVRLSAFGASPDSTSSLLRWHGQIDRELQGSGVAYVILRPNFFMQNLRGYAGVISGTGTLPAPMKDAKISLVDVRDIAAVAAKVLTGKGSEGQIYEITGPEALSFSALADKLSSRLSRKVTYRDVSPEEAKQGLMGVGMPEWLALALVELYGLFSMGLGDRVTTVVKDLTGQPPRTFDQFVRDYLEVFQGRETKAA